MSDAVRELWAWWFVGWGVVGVSLVLMGWGLWGWKPNAPTCRGRRCRYDLSATEAGSDGAVTCPECGRVMRTRRALLGRRRRRRVILVGLVLLGLGWTARVYPSIRDHGWVAAIPSPVLVLLPGTSFDEVHFASVKHPVHPIWGPVSTDVPNSMAVEYLRRRDGLTPSTGSSPPREIGAVADSLWLLRMRAIEGRNADAGGIMTSVRVYDLSEVGLSAPFLAHREQQLQDLLMRYVALRHGDALIVRTTASGHSRVETALTDGVP